MFYSLCWSWTWCFSRLVALLTKNAILVESLSSRKLHRNATKQKSTIHSADGARPWHHAMLWCFWSSSFRCSQDGFRRWCWWHQCQTHSYSKFVNRFSIFSLLLHWSCLRLFCDEQVQRLVAVSTTDEKHKPILQNMRALQAQQAETCSRDRIRIHLMKQLWQVLSNRAWVSVRTLLWQIPLHDDSVLRFITRQWHMMSRG